MPIEVDSRLVAQVVASWTGIPLGKMMKDEAAQILTFETSWRSGSGTGPGARVSRPQSPRGQGGLKNPKTPIGIFLFVSPFRRGEDRDRALGG
ncbi:MAG: hypothetical protein U0527_13435 [Candidatus Eisenbacteria bacterium]